MQTIEQIKVKRKRKIIKTNTLGMRESVIEESIVKRPVKIITSGKRFAHFFADMFLMRIIVGLILAAWTALIPFNDFERGVFMMMFGSILISILSMPLYYFILESIFGTTPGKMLTGCVVINQYAEKPDTKSLLLRSIIRAIPFEAFSCLDNRGWHDEWSNTYVVPKEEQVALQKHLNKEFENDIV